MNNDENLNKTKNWIIGGLVVIILFLGYLAFGRSENNKSIVSTSTTQPTITEKYTSPKVECLTANETWNHIGETKCVEFFVGSPYQSSKGNVFLNEKKDYKTGFTVYIPASSVKSFVGNPISLYGYKTIRVTGLLRMYQGHPEIIVNDPSQIEEVK